MTGPMPSRGEVWLVELGQTQGHEQAGKRPALVVSTDALNHGPAGLVVVAPMTSKDKKIRFHVRVDPPEGGVREASFIKAEDMRSISKNRLISRWGEVESHTLEFVALRLKALLEL
jgi:mRNA interferase MazF